MRQDVVLVFLGLVLAAASGCAAGRGAAAQDLALAGDALWVGTVVATGLATGYDEPGGAERLWVADHKGVSEVAPTGTSTAVWRAPRFSRVVRLEAGDLDGDGIDEWVVLLDQGRMRSFVVGLRDGERVALTRPWNGYLRPVQAVDGSWSLVGQRAGGDGPYRGHVVRVERADDWKLTAGESLGFPLDLPIYDFFQLPSEPGRPQRLFSLEETGHIAERDARSPKASIWRSDGRFVGRPIEVERTYRDLLGDESEATLRLAPPVRRAELDETGAVGALMVGGTHTPVVVFQNLRVFQGGDLRLMKPTSRGLEEVRRSPLLGRAMVAAAQWRISEDHTVWAAVVWTKNGGGFTKPESRVFLLDPATGDLLTAGP